MSAILSRHFPALRALSCVRPRGPNPVNPSLHWACQLSHLLPGPLVCSLLYLYLSLPPLQCQNPRPWPRHNFYIDSRPCILAFLYPLPGPVHYLLFPLCLYPDSGICVLHPHQYPEIRIRKRHLHDLWVSAVAPPDT